MKILFIGDIYGRPGRNTVSKILPALKKDRNIDLVIANAENMRHGKGVNHSNITEMQEAGVDFFTSGNHIFKDPTILEHLVDPDYPLLRPANYPPQVPGNGYRLVESQSGRKVLVINVMGRVFMPGDLDCPFRAVDSILREFEGQDLDAIFVDHHAEASSEKEALGHYLDGRVSVVVGTHSHVPTADARILDGGTAYQGDVGMTGPLNSVIGADKELVIEHFLTQMPLKIEVAKGSTVFNALDIEIDESTRHAVNLEFIRQILD